MSGFVSKEEDIEEWKDTALEYAEAREWRIVPLHINPERTDAGSADPVVEQLGLQPLVTIPAEATASPARIREWGDIPRQAPIGLLTGTDSEIVALEIPQEDRTALTGRDLDRLHGALPDTLCVQGPGRAYHLFSIPADQPALPTLTRFSAPNDGLVLHGEHSVIRLPGPPSRALGRTYTWDLSGPNTPAPFPKALLSFFGIKTDLNTLLWWRRRMGDSASHAPLASSEVEDTERNRSGTDPETIKEGRSPPSPPDGGTERSKSKEGMLTFRSGKQLKTDPSAGSHLDIPWLSPGAMSLLSGPSKTAGKSTFVVNLAVRVAQGRSFLGWESSPRPVVLLSDLPAQTCQVLLARLDLDGDARSRLHIVHPGDTRRLSWTALLRQAFEHASRVQAGLLVIDSLDHFVEMKGGVDSADCANLAHLLATDSPDSCALLAVKALATTPPTPMRVIVDQLGLLGTAADVIVHMSEGPTQAHPTLRRLRFAGRLDAVPSHLLCEMIRGHYRCFRRGDGAAGGLDRAQGGFRLRAKCPLRTVNGLRPLRKRQPDKAPTGDEIGLRTR